MFHRIKLRIPVERIVTKLPIKFFTKKVAINNYLWKDSLSRVNDHQLASRDLGIQLVAAAERRVYISANSRDTSWLSVREKQCHGRGLV